MSQVSWTKQLILALSLFGLGMFAYWVEYKHKPQKEEFDEKAKKIFVLKDIAVEDVVVKDGPRAYAFRCLDTGAKLCKPGDNSKWEVTEPLKLKADDANVNSFISTLNNLIATEIIDLRDETPEKQAALMKEYGLDTASITGPGSKKVDARLGGGERIVAYLGSTHPIGDGIFAAVERVKGDAKPEGKPDTTRVYVLPAYFKANLDKELVYWREKRLLTVSAQDVQGFKLKGTKGLVEGQRKDGQWTLSGDVPGDIENIDSMLSAASYLSAKDFAAEKKDDAKARAALAGASPLVTLTLIKNAQADKKDEPVVLTLYQKGKHQTKAAPAEAHLYATVSNLDPVFELEGSARDRLDKGLKDLRLAKLITSMERFAAKRLELSGGPFAGAKLVLVNKDGKWQHEDGKTVNGDKVQSMLDKLSGNRIREYMDVAKVPSAAGAEKTGLRIVVSPGESEAKASGGAGAGGAGAKKAPRELLFWKAAGQLYARDLGSKRREVYIVDPVIEADLPWKKEHFEGASAPAAAEPETMGAGGHGHGVHDGHGH